MEETKTKLDELKDHSFLEGCTPEHLEVLAELATQATFRKDEIIFRQGAESSLFYLLLSGRVALEVPMPGRTLRIQTVGAGEELGWSSLLSPVEKQFQARSLEPVRVLAFDGARLIAACETNCSLGYYLMRRVLHVVAERLEHTRLQLLDLYAPGARQ